MKTYYQIILATLLVFLSSIDAVGKNGGETLSRQLSAKVKQGLSMPAALKQDATISRKITIYFSVNANGDVTKVNAKTDNREAKKELEDQFRKLNLKGLLPDVCNQIEIDFIVY